AIREGVASLTWQVETFAYAEAWDEKGQRYQGLRAAETAGIVVDNHSLLVKPEAAAAQFAKDRQTAGTGLTGGGTNGGTTTIRPPGRPGHKVEPPPAPKLNRFHGSAPVEPLRLGRDAGRI